MITEKPVFGLTVSNVPVVNIRREFTFFRESLSDERFVLKLKQVREPIETPYFIWNDLPMNLLTYIVQRSILGVEACVNAAAVYQLLARGRFDPKMAEKLNGPGRLLGGKGMADTLYNRIPSQVSSELQLSVMDCELWEQVRRFYREVRNPLFHGYQLDRPPISGVQDAMQMLGCVYGWMDRWWGAFGEIEAFSRLTLPDIDR